MPSLSPIHDLARSDARDFSIVWMVHAQARPATPGPGASVDTTAGSAVAHAVDVGNSSPSIEFGADGLEPCVANEDAKR